MARTKRPAPDAFSGYPREFRVKEYLTSIRENLRRLADLGITIESAETFEVVAGVEMLEQAPCLIEALRVAMQGMKQQERKSA